ncbi:MAG: hypothetical protein AAF289_17590 [Cyanobacteria bacterium P01_A01_bin.135]
MKDSVLTWLNRALVANLFFVLFSFFWLVAAIIGRGLNLPLGLELWYELWEPVFTPAIGILMAGALLNGVWSWAVRRFTTSQ